MTDDEVIEALTKVKGLGRWSAEMFLMFRLRRPDVLPVDDLGIVNAIHRLYKLASAPTRSGFVAWGRPGVPIARWRAGICGEVWRTRRSTRRSRSVCARSGAGEVGVISPRKNPSREVML